MHELRADLTDNIKVGPWIVGESREEDFDDRSAAERGESLTMEVRAKCSRGQVFAKSTRSAKSSGFAGNVKRIDRRAFLRGTRRYLGKSSKKRLYKGKEEGGREGGRERGT